MELSEVASRREWKSLASLDPQKAPDAWLQSVCSLHPSDLLEAVEYDSLINHSDPIK